jgi:copper chaperone
MPGKIESLTIQGMNCGHCVAAVRSALEDLPGVSVQDVSIGSAQIAFDDEHVSHDQISRALEMEGYPVVAFQDVR